jgi:hypothetical protein
MSDFLKEASALGALPGLSIPDESQGQVSHSASLDGGSSGGIDLERLAELVVEKLRDELVIENERSGRM